MLEEPITPPKTAMARSSQQSSGSSTPSSYHPSIHAQLALMGALKRNDVEAFRQAMEMGADPLRNPKDSHDEHPLLNPELEGRTPFHHAAMKGCTEIVKLILDHGRNPSGIDEKNSTPPLTSSSSFTVGQQKIKDYAAAAKDSAGATHRDSSGQQGQTPSKKEEMPYPRKGSVIDVAEKRFNKTALHFASTHGWVDTVALLLAYGASPSPRASDLWSPLHYAAENGHPEVIKLLLSAGADPDCRNEMNQTPVHLAAVFNQLTAFKVLINHYGLCARRKMFDVKKAIMDCAPVPFIDSLALLIGKMTIPQSRLDIRDDWGKTPYDWAVENDHWANWHELDEENTKETVVKFIHELGSPRDNPRKHVGAYYLDLVEIPALTLPA